MVNRIIPYLGRMPHVLHRLDMFTSGERGTTAPDVLPTGLRQHLSAQGVFSTHRWSQAGLRL